MPRPQRKAAVAAEFKMATAGVPDRKSRPTKPPQAPKEPAVVHAPVEAPKEPPMYRAGRQKKPLLPKPVLSAKEQVDKMSVMMLKDYIEVHGLKPKKVPHVWVGGRKKVKPIL